MERGVLLWQEIASGNLVVINGGYFISPAVIMMAAFGVYPMVYGLYLEFYNTNLVNKWKFVGLKYYVEHCNLNFTVQSSHLLYDLVVAGREFLLAHLC